MKLQEAIEKRHSVRKFTSKKPDWRKIIEAVDAANRAPLAGNLQSLRFIVVSDEEKIEKIKDACGQDFVSQASYVVVVCSDETQIKRTYEDRAEMYCRQQAGAAIENFLLRITDLGLGSCWVGAFVDSMIRRALEIPDSIKIEAVLPVGFEMGKSSSRRKFLLDNSIFFDTWKNKYMKPIHKLEI